MFYSVLISPQAKSAYFHEYQSVALKELSLVLGTQSFEIKTVAGMDFIEIDCKASDCEAIARLSFVLGIFERTDKGLIPLDCESKFLLHPDFVFGSKFKGKTNEHLTQLLLNLALHYVQPIKGQKLKLLDPMCGRATTLLWALRYGLEARGIEQDERAIEDVKRNLKKWTKLHRQKHQFKDGFIGKANKQGKGQFLDFKLETCGFRMIQGDAREASNIIKNEKFNIIASDLPYGVQHFTTDKTRNPLAVLEQCAQAWVSMLQPGGVIVLAFNRYIPKRNELLACFERHGVRALDFSAEHRMSESIVRDIVVLQK
ncbi:hypothetical protein DBZ36_15080 [Alginatibacterium sediminis]|uniref:Ribosomal RNA large subunit methyltransferase K/L-like methyltransferase domain-containing protein n=1 Tax=Alginatibacterium sediminis TaxID=2164068 RepID=A0A420E9E4_9ALTE|nr:hypothetical protein [Alginatibacterium sediminis]RKF15702.1 hypothetical protein DBZ36_15080 [Alginatibacterium sediminis]